MEPTYVHDGTSPTASPSRGRRSRAVEGCARYWGVQCDVMLWHRFCFHELGAYGTRETAPISFLDFNIDRDILHRRGRWTIIATHMIMLTLVTFIVVGILNSDFNELVEWVSWIVVGAISVAWILGSMEINDRIAIEHGIMKSVKMNTIRVFNEKFISMHKAKEKYGPNVILWIDDNEHDSSKLRILSISKEWVMKQAFPHVIIVLPVSIFLADFHLVLLAYAWFIFGTVIVEQFGKYIERFLCESQYSLNSGDIPDKTVSMSDWTKMGKVSTNLVTRPISKEWTQCFVSNSQWRRVLFNYSEYDIEILATKNKNEVDAILGSRDIIRARKSRIVTLESGVTLWMKLHWITNENIYNSDSKNSYILDITEAKIISGYDRFLVIPPDV